VPYSAGTAFLDVVPSFRGVQQAIARELRNMETGLGKEAGDKFGEEFGKRAQAAVDKALSTSGNQATTKAATKNANDAADAFGRVFKGRMKSILSALPEIKVDADLTPIQAKIKAIRAEIKSLSDANIGVNLSSQDAMRRAAEVEKVVDRMSRDRTIDLDIAFDSKAVLGELTTLRKVMDSVLEDVEVEIKPVLDGAAAKLVQARLEQAIGDFSVTPNLQTGEVDREVEALRMRLLELRDLHINGYMDISDVVAGVTEVEVLLKALEADRHDIEIKTNATGALKAIAEITALGAAERDTTSWGERLRASLLGQGNDADSAANSFRGFSGIVLGIAAGLPLLVPLLAAAGAGMVALGAAGAGVVAGLGVLIFSFGGVGAALKAMDADQKALGKNTETAARKVRDASASVQKAEESVSRARENAGRAAQSAARQVSDAVDSQKSAEQDLVRAQADVVRAQQEVTRAREDARRRIEDLKLSLEGGAIAERQAVLDLTEAEAKYRKVMNDPKADAGAREQAAIDLERRRLGLKEIRLENGRLGKEQAEVNKTGIEGSREVVSAQEGVKRAQDGVTAAMGRVADAGQAVSDALANQKEVQQRSAESIGAAQEGLAKAQQAYRDALFDTGEQGSATGRAVSEAFGKMGPAGQIFTLFLKGVKDDLIGLRNITQAGIFPGLQSAISDILTKNGPMLRSFLTSMSQTIGGLFRELGDLLTGAQWRAIFSDFSHYAPIFMEQFGHVGMNLLTFFGGLFQAFAPMAKDFGDWIVDTTAKMRDWALGLKQSEGFKSFLDYVSVEGPRIWALFRDILTTILHIAEGIAPFAGVLLGALDSVFKFLAALDPQVIGAITTAVLGLTVAFQLAHGAITILHQGFDLMKHGLSKWIFILGGAVTVLTALYTTSEPVRDFLNWMFGIVGDLVGVFTDLPGVVQIAIGALAGITLLRGPFSDTLRSINLMFDGLRLGIPAAKDAIGGLATKMGTVSGAAGVAKSGASKFMNFLGGPWTLAIGAGITALGFLVESMDESGRAAESAKNYQKDLTQALIESKGAIDGNVEAMARQKAADLEIGDSNLLRIVDAAGVSVPLLTQALLGNREAYAKVKKGLEEYQAAHTFMRADAQGNPITFLDDEGKAAEGALTHLGPLAGVMEGAAKTAGLMAEGTDKAAESQARLDAAADRVNEALAIQQQKMMDMYESQKNFDDATADLAKAHNDVADALKAEGENSDAYRGALSRLEDQAYNTASAAGKVAEARHDDADETEKQLFSNAAILENLRLQEQKYGELPPRLAQLKQSLEDTVPAAYQAGAKFEALGLKVVGVPNSKRIVVSSTSDEQMAALEALGVKVKELPDGTVELTADTAAAQKIIDDFIGTPRRITIGAGVDWDGPGHSGRGATTKMDGSFNTPGRAAGGPIYGPGGPTSDSILARLSNGEYVVRAASVQKYGVQFLEAINAGRFATGGLVGRGSIPGFAGGGLAANWGGSINLSGGNTNPLAEIWFEAIAAINRAAAMGSQAIAAHFSGLRGAVVGTLNGLKGQATGIWSAMIGNLVPATRGLQGNVSGIIGSMRANVGSIFTGMTATAKSLWSGMGSSLRGTTRDTSNHSTSVFGSMRSSVAGIFTDTISKVKGIWNQIAVITQRPINFVINSVLNNGLFKAFNGIIGTLGLPKTWKIPTAAAVPTPKLAAGGRVPGWSANDTHDNIPAWLTANEYVLPVKATRRLRQTVGEQGLESLRRGMLPQFAQGGLVAFGRRLQSMGARVSEHPAFGGVTPGAHVRGSKHYTGQAIDVNTRPGTSAAEQRELSPMMALARQLGFHVIFMSSGHFNHGHVDTGAPGEGGSGAPVSAPAWYDLFGSVAGVLSKLQDSIKGGDEVDKRFGSSGLSNVLEALPAKALGWIWGKAKDTIGNLFTGVMDTIQEGIAGIGNLFSGGSSVEAAINAVAGKYGWGQGAEHAALMRIIQKESSGNPTAQNPSSTAYGLFQFLNSTWGSVGGYKTSNPALQTEFGLRYIKSRYGTPSKALAFHESHNWYSEGGEVGAPGPKADVPTLYDTGGWLPPGLTTVMNATGRPEPILTGEQWDQLLQTGGGGDGLIGQLHIHEVATNIEEAIGAVNHNVRVLSNGGRYATRGDDD
jgi:hypothetical protein